MDVPAAGEENEQVQISSVTDVMPALAVWLTNVSVFIPGVYGQEVVQLVSFMFEHYCGLCTHSKSDILPSPQPLPPPPPLDPPPHLAARFLGPRCRS